MAKKTDEQIDKLEKARKLLKDAKSVDPNAVIMEKLKDDIADALGRGVSQKAIHDILKTAGYSASRQVMRQWLVDQKMFIPQTRNGTGNGQNCNNKNNQEGQASDQNNGDASPLNESNDGQTPDQNQG